MTEPLVLSEFRALAATGSEFKPGFLFADEARIIFNVVTKEIGALGLPLAKRAGRVVPPNREG